MIPTPAQLVFFTQWLGYNSAGSPPDWQLYFLLVALSIVVALASFFMGLWYMRHRDIQQSYKELEVAVKQRTNSLYVSSNKLKLINSEMDRFMYHTSHDFRRPLSTIMGLVEVAKITVTDQEALLLFLQINQTATNLDSMLKKLLLLHEINLLSEEKTDVRLCELLKEIEHLLTPILKQNQVELRSSFRGEEVFTFYANLFKQLLLNITENAILFFDPSVEDAYVNIDIFNDGHWLTVEVSDNGVGIPSELAEKVFEAFFKGTTRSRGNGLGMFVARKGAERLGGKLELVNIRKPTTFRLLLPLKQPTGLEEQAPDLT